MYNREIFSRNESNQNLSGNDKLRLKLIEKISLPMRDHPSHLTALPDKLKAVEGTIIFFMKKFQREIKNNMNDRVSC